MFIEWLLTTLLVGAICGEEENRLSLRPTDAKSIGTESGAAGIDLKLPFLLVLLLSNGGNNSVLKKGVR